jgi:hypothetical protein
MMQLIVSILLGVITFIVGYLFFRKGCKHIYFSPKIQDKRKAFKTLRIMTIVGSVVFYVICGFLISFVPSFSLSFSTPEEAFDLKYSLERNVAKDDKTVIQGENSAAVFAPSVGTFSSRYYYGVFYKTDSGWKMAGSPFDFKKRQDVVTSNYYFVQLLPCKKTQEWYIMIMVSDSENPGDISDSLGSSFVKLNDSNYVAYIGATPEEPYILTVDGESKDISYLFQF